MAIRQYESTWESNKKSNLGNRAKQKAAKVTQLSDTLKPVPKSRDRPGPSKETKSEDSSKDKTSLTGALASASAAMSGRGTAGRILKAGLAGASAGHQLEKSYREYKKERKKKKAKKATTTVTQSAMTQKANFHKKDETPTEKY
ncbi:hypothetical protein LCGC14_0329780 [marine sediment metagenome]|uniref:Uncharacterized protein n=1 Tax=marine sediment metagenome TaxID=412755 RepID=A0A0F9TGN1_9ZZZZ